MTRPADTHSAKREAALAELRQLRDQQQRWLDTLAAHNELAPFIADGVETIKWVVDALESAPPEAQNVDLSPLLGQISWAKGQADVVLGAPLPTYVHGAGEVLWAANSVVASSVANHLSRVGELPTPDSRVYVERRLLEYVNLHPHRRRAIGLRRLIEAAMPTVMSRFAEAEREYDDCRAGIGSYVAATNAMRNLLDAIKGEVMQEARGLRSPSFSGWPSGKLFFPLPDCGVLASAFDALGVARAVLYDSLSRAAKHRDGKAEAASLWAQTLDSAVGTIGLLKESRFNLGMRREGKSDIKAN